MLYEIYKGLKVKVYIFFHVDKSFELHCASLSTDASATPLPFSYCSRRDIPSVRNRGKIIVHGLPDNTTGWEGYGGGSRGWFEHRARNNGRLIKSGQRGEEWMLQWQIASHCMSGHGFPNCVPCDRGNA